MCAVKYQVRNHCECNSDASLPRSTLGRYEAQLRSWPVSQTLLQDHQALLKAKYCPRVAAASCTQKKPM